MICEMRNRWNLLHCLNQGWYNKLEVKLAAQAIVV